MRSVALLAICLLAATSAVAEVDIEELRTQAKTAAGQKRYCDASFFFGWIYDATGAAKELYNAAEVAYAADDRSRALSLYQKLRDDHKGFRKLDTVQERLRSLAAIMADSGFGKTCKPPVRAVVPPDDPPPDDPPDDPPPDDPPPDDPPTASSCGDGVVQRDETCDDGNTISGDGCDANCKPTGCLNGIVAGDEICDDGNVEDGDGCDTNCTATGCGNGVLTRGEACDDGNLENGDGCSSTCEPDQAEKKGGGGGGGLGWLTAGAGLFLTAGGGVLTVVGVLPLVQHGQARARLDELEADLEGTSGGDRDAILQEAAARNREQRDAAINWETYGAASTAAGVGLVVVGLGLTIAGVAMAVSE